MRQSSLTRLVFLQLLVLVLLGVLPQCQSCTVMDAEGVDITNQVLDASAVDVITCPEGDTSQGPTNVFAICYNATISNCHTVTCQGLEACFYTTMINITDRVDCLGKHSCHRSDIVMSRDGPVGTVPKHKHAAKKAQSQQQQQHVTQQTVTCQGEMACDVATITRFDIQNDIISFHPTTTTTNNNNNDNVDFFVKCLGPQACRKAHMEATTVECTDGNVVYPACSGFATVTTHCLVCGWNGCHDRLNDCRVTTWLDIAEGHDSHLACPVESLVGDCDTQWYDVLQQTLEDHQEDNNNAN